MRAALAAFVLTIALFFVAPASAQTRTADEQALFHCLADHAAGVLEVLAWLAGSAELTHPAGAALSEQSVIDNAVGMLMVRDGLGSAQALTDLTRAATDTGVGLDAAARAITTPAD